MSIEDNIENNVDKTKGHLEEVAGELTDDESLKAEGQADQAKGKFKDKIDHALDSTKEKLHDAADAVTAKLHHHEDGEKS